MLDQRTVRFLAEELAGFHRDHEQATVGQPTEAGGLVVRDFCDGGRVAVDGAPQHRVTVHVAEPECGVVPAGTFAERETLDQGARCVCGHRRLRSLACTIAGAWK